MSIVSYLWMVLYFCCLFSYPSLLELHYSGRMSKSQTTREQAMEVGLLVREAEWRIDTELFLDEYPRWKLGAPHWSVILHEMFLQAAEQGWKEAERLICQGHCGSVSRPDLEADQSTMELMGYRTSHKEIWDIYHSVYLLKRSPGLPPCGSQWRREAIHDILSSLRSQLHWWVYPATASETWGPVDKHQSRPRRGDSYEEVLQEVRTAHQRVLEATQVLKSDIERLSWGMRDMPLTHFYSHSRSCPQSHSLDRWLRSPSRSQQGRRVTFWEPEAEPDPKESGESYPPKPSIIDVDTWLDWQAHQLDMPCWWMELTAIPGVEDPWKLTQKIQASFSIPEVRSRVFLGQDYTAPPAPKCLTQHVFLLDELSYQDVWHQPFLLTVAYAWGLQYWAEELNPPENPDFHPLARSVIELREREKEHVMFTKWDVNQGVGRVNLGAASQWPQTSSTSFRRMDPPLSPRPTPVGDQPVEQNTSFMEATTHTASPAMSRVELTRPITPLDRMEGENWYIQAVTVSIRQLNLGTTSVDLRESVTASPGKGAFQNPCMVAVLLGPAKRAISGQGTIVKELEVWCRMLN